MNVFTGTPQDGTRPALSPAPERRLVERRWIGSRLFRALAFGEQLIELASGLAAITLGVGLLFWWRLVPPWHATILRVAPQGAWCALFILGGWLAVSGHVRRDRRTRRLATFGGACTWGWMALMLGAVGTTPVSTSLLSGLSAGLALDYIRLSAGAR